MASSVRRTDYVNPRFVEAARDLLADAAASIRATRLGTALELVCPGRESAPESLSAGHMYDAGLPMPRFQAEIPTSAGTFFADCLWEEQRLIGECDGAVKYNDAQAYVREKAREQTLRDEGYRFVRWLATEAVLQPRCLVDRIERALGL